MKYGEVFLAGMCGKSTWRQKIAIPLLEAANITYYNPQYPESMWHEGLMAAEREAKRHAHWIIDVIGGETRGTASIMEATELVCTGKQVMMVIEDVQSGTEVFGVPVIDRDLEDTNRCRAYLRELIRQRKTDDEQRYPDAFVASSVEEATKLVIARIENIRRWSTK